MAARRFLLPLPCRLPLAAHCCSLIDWPAASAPPFAVELMKPGNWVTLRNAKVDMFRGSMRLVVNQVSKLAGPGRVQPWQAAWPWQAVQH